MLRTFAALSLALAAASATAVWADEIKRSDSDVPPTGDYPGFYGSGNLDQPYVQCPDGSYVVGIQVFRRHPQVTSPMDDMRYLCRSARDGTFAVRKTSSQLADQGNMQGAATSEPYDSAVARCPDGYFVTGIQGFKPRWEGATTQTPLSALRYHCRPAHGGPPIVRKTDQQIPDGGSFGNFSGTLNPEASITRCSDGFFVTGIQGFAALYQDHSTAANVFLNEFRYSCKPLRE